MQIIIWCFIKKGLTIPRENVKEEVTLFIGCSNIFLHNAFFLNDFSAILKHMHILTTSSFNVNHPVNPRAR